MFRFRFRTRFSIKWWEVFLYSAILGAFVYAKLYYLPGMCQ